ncbi:MAG: protease modulator HflC [Alphaproteobacteria bacterium]|nr:protease modulator HflC [Alphaproteobacteria bacterium]
MKKNLHLILIGAFVLLIILFQSLYVVMQPEQAIVLQFGDPVRLVQEPGLKFKIPFIQNVVFYDKRLLNLEPPAQEVVLKDKKRLDVDTFSRYRITEPLTFYKTVRTEYQAQNRLQEIVNSSARNVLATVTLLELLSGKRTEIMKRISEAVKQDAAQIGVEVADVRIRRADLPVQVSQAINDRMKTERIREAKGYRADGEKKAQEIKATADKEATITVANAEKEAQQIKGEGDKAATEIWNKATSIDPEFYAFYRTLEAYRNSFNSETSIVIAPEGEFFNYFGKSLK